MQPEDRSSSSTALDAINAMRAKVEIPPDQLDGVLERTVLGFHRAVAGMVVAGNDVVVDHVLRERSWLLDCLELLEGGDVRHRRSALLDRGAGAP